VTACLKKGRECVFQTHTRVISTNCDTHAGLSIAGLYNRVCLPLQSFIPVALNGGVRAIPGSISRTS